MIKHILLDADGVIIKPHGQYSTVYAQENNLSLEAINVFFKEKFPACKAGLADLKIELEPYLAKWNPGETVDNYLATWFAYEMHIDEQVVAVMRALKAQGIKLYLATDQEKYRAEYIANIPDIKTLFDDLFISYQLGVSKESPVFFEKVTHELRAVPDEIAFFDDEPENIQSAKNTGIHSFLFTHFSDLKNQLQKLGIDV